MMIITSKVWEWGNRGVFITSDLFFDMIVQIKIKIKIYRMIGNFTGFQNI
jgi:hypothetical protein